VLAAATGGEEANAAKGASKGSTSRLARAIQRVHLPSMAMDKKVEVSSAVVSAVAGTASLVLTATACSVM